MTSDIKTHIEIARPHSTVVELMFDPKNDPLWWNGLILESKPQTPGRFHVGQKITRVIQFLGIKFSYECEMINCIGDTFAEGVATHPFPIRHGYSAHPNGPHSTTVGLTLSIDPAGYFRVTEVGFDWTAGRSLNQALKSLKKIIESGDRSQSEI